MFMRQPSLPGALIFGVISLFCSLPAGALWLNVYGTGAEAGNAQQLVKVVQGGYAVSGQVISNNQTLNWYGHLDEQGQVKWARSSGNVIITLDKNGAATLQTVLAIGQTLETVQTTARVSLNDGSLSDIVPLNHLELAGNNGRLALSKAPGIYVGTWKLDNGQTDAVIAKTVNNQLVWSHRFNAFSNDGIPTVYALTDGYLLSLSAYNFNTLSRAAEWTTILARLDNNGNLISGSARKFTESFGFYPTVLRDGSVVLSNQSTTGDFVLYKLDKNLNFVWGQRYYSGTAGQSLANLGLLETPDGRLVIQSYQHQTDDTGELTERHPLAIVLNAKDGSILMDNEIIVGQLDSYPVQESGLSQYRLFGTTEIITAQQPAETRQNGLFGIFKADFQPEWTKVLEGTAMDKIAFFQKAEQADNYLLAGITQSWGSGKPELLAAKLDGQGAIPGCGIIKDFNPVVAAANLLTASVISPFTSAQLLDQGPVEFTATAQQYALEVDTPAYPLTVTPLCQADDIVVLPPTAPDPNPPPVVKPPPVVVSNPLEPEVKPPPIVVNKPEPEVSSPPPVISNNPVNPEINSGVITLKPVTVVVPPKNPAVNPAPNSPLIALSATQVGAGAKIVVTGQGFGNKRGKVLIGARNAALLSWSDTRIELKIPTMKAGTYPVKLIAKTGVVAENLSLTINVPQVSRVALSQNAKASLAGQYFGTALKPKVYLIADKIRKAATVLPGHTENNLTLKLPKLAPAAYRLLITTSAGTGSADNSLEIQ